MALLERRRDDESDATRRKELVDEMINISVDKRVLCPLTSLLVLETERDYERFEIDRRALVRFEEKRGVIEKAKKGNGMTLGDMITIKKRGK